MTDSLQAFRLRVERLEAEFDGTAEAARLRRLGELSKPDISAAVRNDLGDLSMSGWKRGNPFEIGGMYEVVGPHEVEMAPARKVRGPMRVLEQGRAAYQSGDRRVGGTYITKRTGEVRTKYRKVKRTMGATQGKGTWTDAEAIMAAKMPPRYHSLILEAYAKHLKG